MSPKRRLLSHATRTVLAELGIGLYYVDGGTVLMGGADGGPWAPASMESVEEACAAVRDAASFRDEAHRFEVLLAHLDSARGLDVDIPVAEPLGQTLYALGAAPPDAVLDDRTQELARWEQILDELRPERAGRPGAPRRSRAFDA